MKRKRILATSLAMLMMANSMSVTVFAHQNNDYISSKVGSSIYKDGFAVTGRVLSIDDFDRAFVGFDASNIMPRSAIESSMSISDIVINDSNINFTAILNTGGENTYLEVGGTLKSGTRTSNTIIVEVENKISGHEILLFEIHNYHGGGRVILDNSNLDGLYDRPHVKLYLLDEFGRIHLLEAEMPEILSTLQSNNFEQIEDARDMLWGMRFAHEPKIEVFPATQEYLDLFGIDLERYVIYTGQELSTLSDATSRQHDLDTFGLNTNTFWSGNVHRLTYNILGGGTMHTMSMPYVRFRFANVVAAHTSPWRAEFRVAQHTVLDNNEVRHGLPHIGYANVRVQFAVGERTEFRSTHRGGRVGINPNANSGTNVISSRLLFASTVLPALPGLGGVTAQIVLDLIDRATFTRNNVNLNPSGSTQYSSNVVSSGQRLDDYLFWYNSSNANGHYLVQNSYLLRNGVAGSRMTDAVLTVEYEVIRLSNRSVLERVRRDFPFRYTVS